MKSYLNQKGYSLLIVLFLIVFIITVTAVFMRGSIGNAKQEKIIDKNQLSVVVAEMGIEYFESVFTNNFMREKDNLWKEYNEDFIIKKTAIEKDNKFSDSKKKELINALAIETQGKLAEGLKEKLEENKHLFTNDVFIPINAQYIFSDFNITIRKDVSNPLVVVEVFSIGKIGKEKRIFVDLVFDIPTFAQDKQYSENNLVHSYLNWTQGEIDLGIKPKDSCKKPPIGERCLGSSWESIKNAKNAQIYFSNEIVKNNNGNIGDAFGDTVLLAEKGADFPNMNNLSKMKVLSYGDINMKNVKKANYFTVETRGDLEVDHFEIDNDLKNNRILVGGNFTSHKSFISYGLMMSVIGNMTLNGNGNNKSKVTNSAIYVDNNLNLNSNSNSNFIIDNSLVCVRGEINLNKVNLQGDSKLIVTNNAKNLDSISVREKINSGKIQVTTSGGIKSQCAMGKTERKDVWKSPKIEVDYK